MMTAMVNMVMVRMMIVIGLTSCNVSFLKERRVPGHRQHFHWQRFPAGQHKLSADACLTQRVSTGRRSTAEEAFCSGCCFPSIGDTGEKLVERHGAAAEDVCALAEILQQLRHSHCYGIQRSLGRSGPLGIDLV